MVRSTSRGLTALPQHSGSLPDGVSAKCKLLLFALSGLASILVTQAQTCSSTITPSDQEGPFYLPNSPFTSFIGPEERLQDPNQSLFIRGRVLSTVDPLTTTIETDSTGCQPQYVGVPGVSIELWYAGPIDLQGNYYQDDEYRGQVVTDVCGFYNLTQVFPSSYPVRPILHNHFRLVQNGNELLITQMYFARPESIVNPSLQDQQYYVDPNIPNPQAATIETDEEGARHVEFDFYVNYAGNLVLGPTECPSAGTIRITPDNNSSGPSSPTKSPTSDSSIGKDFTPLTDPSISQPATSELSSACSIGSRIMGAFLASASLFCVFL